MWLCVCYSLFVVRCLLFICCWALFVASVFDVCCSLLCMRFLVCFFVLSCALRDVSCLLSVVRC